MIHEEDDLWGNEEARLMKINPDLFGVVGGLLFLLSLGIGVIGTLTAIDHKDSTHEMPIGKSNPIYWHNGIFSIFIFVMVTGFLLMIYSAEKRKKKL